jgi:ribosomal protein S27E
MRRITVIRNDVIDIKKPNPDSQYRLRTCRKCGSDNVAYVHYDGKGGAKWRVECFDCGHMVDKGNRVRHDAQMAWNEGAR